MFILDYCVCSFQGDPHYNNYKGKKMNFQGKCSYLYTRVVSDDDDCKFEVRGKHTPSTRFAHATTFFAMLIKIWYHGYAHVISVEQGRETKVSTLHCFQNNIITACIPCIK